MAQTATIPLGRDWLELTAGPAVVTLTADSPDAFFALREAAGAPVASVMGHHLPFRENTQATLSTGTRLYVRGRSGNLSWSRDAV